jgi:hypothetical protein
MKNLGVTQPAHDAVGQEQHDADEQSAHDNGPELDIAVAELEFAEARFAVTNDQRAQDGADQRATAADRNHDDDLDRGDHTEAVWAGRAHGGGVKRPGDAGDRARERKYEGLVHGGVVAQGHNAIFVVAHGSEDLAELAARKPVA